MALIGVYICVSRVSDNKHHPSDVIAGALLGVVSALLVVCTQPTYFNCAYLILSAFDIYMSNVDT